MIPDEVGGAIRGTVEDEFIGPDSVRDVDSCVIDPASGVESHVKEFAGGLIGDVSMRIDALVCAPTRQQGAGFEIDI